MEMNNLVDRLLRRFVLSWNEHLSDEKLAGLICRELSFIDAWIAEHHLATCRYCRSRRWSLEGPRARRMIKLYGDLSRVDESETLSEGPRQEFAQWLHFEIRRATSHTLQHPRAQHRLWTAMPAVSIGLILGLLIGAVIVVLSWRRVPEITANSLLVHAEKWDASVHEPAPGVAHQTIRIKTPNRTLDRSIYWDLQGKRHLRHVTLAGSEQQLKLELGNAGVDWERPISASAYQDWHDHQHIRADRIAQTGDHLLTLTTTVPDGIVSQQSITVRDTDFHPVRRTVGFRDNDTVEIAELDYRVLPWSGVDVGVFEPEETMPVHQLQLLPSPHNLPEIPESRSPEQLDETELAARLILNKLHADEGEQIEVRQLGQQVEIVGLVNSDDRKHKLIAQLMTVPGLKLSIRSEADLSASGWKNSDPVSVEATTLPDNPSALETYLRYRRRPTEEINAAAQQLFEEALIISKESRFIVDLKTRFVNADQMPVVTAATLEELLYSHHERLELALHRESASLAQATGVSAPAPRASNCESSMSGSHPLILVAGRNLALARELTQTNVTHPRIAEQIFSDMAATLDCLYPVAREAYTGTQVNPVAGGKE